MLCTGAPQEQEPEVMSQQGQFSSDPAALSELGKLASDHQAWHAVFRQGPGEECGAWTPDAGTPSQP